MLSKSNDNKDISKPVDALEKVGRVNFDDFKKVDLRVGTVLEASRVEGSEKLLKLIVDLGVDTATSAEKPLVPTESPSTSLPDAAVGTGRIKRQILSGIGKWYAPEALIGKQIVLVVNLEPRKMMGMESQGMILAASGPDGISVLFPEKPVPPGAQIT